MLVFFTPPLQRNTGTRGAGRACLRFVKQNTQAQYCFSSARYIPGGRSRCSSWLKGTSDQIGGEVLPTFPEHPGFDCLGEVVRCCGAESRVPMQRASVHLPVDVSCLICLMWNTEDCYSKGMCRSMTNHLSPLWHQQAQDRVRVTLIRGLSHTHPPGLLCVLRGGSVNTNGPSSHIFLCHTLLRVFHRTHPSDSRREDVV